MHRCDVVIIGAGPYGLSAAAHLQASGVDVRIFGDVMSFWRQMPQGMLLRSAWDGSHLSDPAGGFTLHAYQRSLSCALPPRLDMTQFTRYGEWFQRQAAPNVDPRFVKMVEAAERGFIVRLADGEPLQAGRVVVATGLTGMAAMPAPFAGLPQARISHASEERDLARHRGKRVAVIGSGQSALESAALLVEGGAASVEVISRASCIHWLGGGAKTISRETGRWAKVIYPPGAVGPLGINWIVQLPGLYRALPEPARQRVFARALRPAASGWLRTRTEAVGFTIDRSVIAATVNGAVRLTLTDGSERVVDHVLLGTGYKIDVDRYPFLSPALAQQIRRRDRQPWLGDGLESSVAGLHFVGAPSDLTYGPLMRFVAGAGYAAAALTRAVHQDAPNALPLPEVERHAI